MPIHVNDEKTLHHACSGLIIDATGRIIAGCGYIRLDVPHSEVEVIPPEPERPEQGFRLVLECPSCGARECFNANLPPEEEQAGHLGHQQQAQHICQLQQHLGLPRIEERQSPPDRP